MYTRESPSRISVCASLQVVCGLRAIRSGRDAADPSLAPLQHDGVAQQPNFIGHTQRSANRRAMKLDRAVAESQGIGDLLGRDPHTLLSPGYFDEPTIRADLATARFRDVKVDRIVRQARAASARDAAVITVQGSLLRTAIETANPSRLGEATKAVGQVMSARFGDGPIEGETKALIVTATKP